MVKIFVTDIEGDGLYDKITKFHCAWIIDPVTNERWGFRPHQLAEYCDKLAEADVVVGHNICDFDCPALKKLNGVLNTKGVFDTIVLSRILFPDRVGGHSLKAWGITLGILKGDYGKVDEDTVEDVWAEFNEPMYAYCEQDVEVTVVLFKHLCEKAGFDYTNPPNLQIKWDEF